MHKHAKRCLSKTSCPILITSWSREKRYQLFPCIHLPVPEQGSLGMKLHTGREGGKEGRKKGEKRGREGGKKEGETSHGD